MKSIKTLILVGAAAFAFAACQKDEPVAVQEPATAEPVAGKTVPAASGASPGKPQAPISMRYEIMGNPIVGQPLLINVFVSSAEGPVSVHYSLADRSALMFQDGQVERLEIADPSRDVARQVSVIPQREGRLYLNVAAEVQTPSGAMIRSMAIPIRAGAASEEAAPNGEVVEGPDGEAVISLPAKETN